ncbi:MULTISPECIES: DNA cytosine methyltransferase [unclassified Citrobacter]|uniref:DNA cytosine methyltransferase n=1 Tax=unclassified Citrobacter TaxID=2644389 RepID=UPI0015E97711|nr:MULTISPECIES: DNA cytosine methyltransferase [unclassified Citrobacter]MBA8060813.1 DNA cytosine methyltransferase [Citrobacter sp. RHBSTW-00104]QLZ28924.1 DNA cytosine methyltransferase [Citrobacter sp. RHBSTW-00137]
MRIIDLFSGCGGLSLGFQKGGHEVIGAYDFWDPAIECYRDNFNHPITKLDLGNVDEVVKELASLDFDMIIGGPPCQDFSHAGLRVEGARANLTLSFSEVIKRIKPKWFVMENVDRALKSSTYSVVRKTFKEAGYGLTEVVLDASKCGVPQKRKRLFVIGCIGREDDFLIEEINNGLSIDSMTVRDYFGDELGIDYYYRHPRNYNRRGVFSIDEPAPTIRGVNRPIPDGYTGHVGDPVKISNNVRPLTTLERAQIQTFPKDFKFKGAKTHLEQMIGNAVPVELARYVAVAIMNDINKNLNYVAYDKDNFRKWLSLNKKLTRKSLSDVISRFNRAVSFFGDEYVDFHVYKIDEILMRLERIHLFDILSVSLKSQLRRSFKLYYEFCNDRK